MEHITSQRLLTPNDILIGNTDWVIDNIEFDIMLKDIFDKVLENNTQTTSTNELIDIESNNNQELQLNETKNNATRKKISPDVIHRINALVIPDNMSNTLVTEDSLISYNYLSNEYVVDRNARFECLKNGIPRSSWNKNRKLECHRQNRTFDNRIIVN